MKKQKITIITGISIDGKISLDLNTSSKIFDQSIDKSAFEPLVELKEKHDAVMVGCNTIMTDNANLIGNEFYNVNNQIKRIIVDSKCKIPLNYKIFINNPERTIIATTKQASRRKIDNIVNRGCTVIVCGNKRVDLKKLFQILAGKNIKSILVEGGGKLNFSLLKDDLIDELIVVVFPFVVGNINAPSLFDGNGFNKKLYKLDLRETRVIKDNIFLHFKLGRHND